MNPVTVVRRLPIQGSYSFKKHPGHLQVFRMQTMSALKTRGTASLWQEKQSQPPLLKQTKKKDCFNRREASVIDANFIHTFYPTPSILAVKMTESSYSSPAWLPPILLRYTQTTSAYQSTLSSLQEQPCGRSFHLVGLPKLR